MAPNFPNHTLTRRTATSRHNCPARAALDRPEIAEKYRITPADRDTFLHLLDHDAIPLPHHAAAGVCRDPDDYYLLGCAAHARIEYLVTGDDDLLKLKRFEIVVILTARDFLTIVAR